MPDWLVTRAMWGARPPRSVTGLSMATGCTAHYVGPRMGAFPHSSCATKVRGIQAFHMGSRGWSDIAYSALACPHGFVFAGRGPGVRTAANGTNAGNSAHLAICALTGDGDPITPDLMLAMWRARAWLMGSGKCGPERKQHSDWKATSCPGPIGRRFKTETPALTPTPQPAPTPVRPKEDSVQLITSDEIPPDGKLHPFVVAPVNAGAYGDCYVSVAASAWAKEDLAGGVRVSVGSDAEGWQIAENVKLTNGRVNVFKVNPGGSRVGNIVNGSKVPVVVLVEHFLA